MVLCDEPKHVQPGDRGGILQALALGVVELPRDGEDLGEGTKNWQCKKLDKTVTLVQGSSTVLSFFFTIVFIFYHDSKDWRPHFDLAVPCSVLNPHGMAAKDGSK